MILKTFGHKELQPYGSFHLLDYQWSNRGQADVAIVGESATLVGWIPFCDDGSFDDLAAGFLREAWKQEGSSVPVLLKSGNNPPPENFNGPGSLKRFMGPKQFRAVLSIDAPTLYLNSRGAPTGLQFLAMAQVGTTPYRAEYLISERLWFTMFSGGNARVSGDISEKHGCVKVRLFIRIRIGWLGRRAAMAMGNDEPPWANVMIEYDFHYQERFGRVSFWGTAVPSQDHYLNWRRKSCYDMERQMSGAAYRGFITAGGNMDAMTQIHDTHLCGLREMPISADETIGDE